MVRGVVELDFLLGIDLGYLAWYYSTSCSGNWYCSNYYFVVHVLVCVILRRVLVLLVLVGRSSVDLVVEKDFVSGTASAFVENAWFDLVVQTWEASHVFGSMGSCPSADMLGFVAGILVAEVD